jgi:uncharacterized membrane protein (UPF0182 family)
VYETPQGTTGPANADSYIQATQSVSREITLLDQRGSEVLLGNTLMVPVGQAIVYLRPLYVASLSNPQPQLEYVVGVLGQKVVIESTVSQTLTDLFHTSVSTGGGSSSPPSTTTPATVPANVTQYLAAAQTDYMNALTALAAANLGQYQSDISAMQVQITNAQNALTAASGTTTTTTTTTPSKTTPSTTTTTTPTKSKSPTTKKAKTPSSTEPKDSATTTTLATAEAPR